MYREDGKLAARGRHVKYLPMGRMWDLAMTPLAFPLTRITSNRLRDRVLADPERTKARKTEKERKGSGRENNIEYICPNDELHVQSVFFVSRATTTVKTNHEKTLQQTMFCFIFIFSPLSLDCCGCIQSLVLFSLLFLSNTVCFWIIYRIIAPACVCVCVHVRECTLFH